MDERIPYLITENDEELERLELYLKYNEPVELAYGKLSYVKQIYNNGGCIGKVKLEMDNGSVLLSNFDDEIQEFYESHSDGQFRICDQCGKPYDAGYMHEEGGHWCSEECVKADVKIRYGDEGICWKFIDDWSKEEKEKFANENSDAVGCLIYLDGDEWVLDETFYTEWY